MLLMRAIVGAGGAAVVSLLSPRRGRSRTVVLRMVRVSEVAWMTAPVVVGRDSFTSVILFSVVGEIIVADFSDTVAVMDLTDMITRYV